MKIEESAYNDQIHGSFLLEPLSKLLTIEKAIEKAMVLEKKYEQEWQSPMMLESRKLEMTVIRSS